MTRRYTAAEARELKERATHDPLSSGGVKSAITKTAKAVARRPRSFVETEAEDLHAALAAVTAERDALREKAREYVEARAAWEHAEELLYALEATRSPDVDVNPMRVAARVTCDRYGKALAALREAAK